MEGLIKPLKKMIALVLFFGCVAFLMPYSWLLLTTAYDEPDLPSIPVEEEPTPPMENVASEPIETDTIETESVYSHSEFYIYCTDRSGVLTVPVKEYIIGAIAAEMPLEYPREALKAQAIASYSYAAARAENKEPGDSPMNSDFSANPSQYEGFLTENELRHLWGNSYDENHQYLSDIVDELGAMTLTYDNKPALSCYFPLSNGVTLPSESVFGVDVPYLVSVDSTYDKESVEFEQKITFTSQQVFDVLNSSFDVVELGEDPTQWLGEANYDNYGYMTDISVGSIVVDGESLRAALGLRSTSMQIEYADNIFIFTTQGSGHAVGMSQFGAKMMAQNGYTYDVILQYYYPGTELKTI